ncbi:MAG: hypothetical protein AAGL92_05045 [Pseudomonadota bacterium]
MSALLKLPIHNDRPAPEVPEDVRPLLNKLRFAATTCRASARLDIFAACAVLDPNETRAEAAQINTLLRVMGQALGKEPVFLRPGVETTSFDERWLIAALMAKTAGDENSFAFLLLSRVEHSKRRIFALLLSGLAEFLTE